MKKDRNILLIAGLVVGAIMLGIAGYYLYRGIIQFNIEEEKLSKAKADLDKIYAQKPFPSDKNRKIEQANSDTLRLINSNMIVRMSQAQIDPDVNMTPSAFKNLLRDKQQEFIKLAKDAGVSVAKDFSFGFKKYTMGGEMPRVEDVPRLAQQLKITEELVKVLCAAKVKEIVNIERDAFDSPESESASASVSSSAESSSRGSRGRGSRPPRGAAAAGNNDAVSSAPAVKQKDAGIIPPSEQFARLHFKLEIKLKEETLVALLNDFASHAMFITVSQLSIPRIEVPKVSLPGKKAAETVQPDPLENVLAGDSPAASSTNTPAVKMDERNKGARLVCGPSVEKPFPVVMEVDVFRFKHAEEGVKRGR